MTKLRLLALNNNELHFVANGAFVQLYDLEEIWLRNNRLVYIPRGLPDKLRKLYMDSNRIRIIENGLFSNTSRLDYLTVENNKLNRIQNKTFLGLKFLKSLNFRGNKLRVIEKGTFHSLRNLSTLSLSNNPLQRVEADAFVDLENLTFLHLDMCGEKMTLEQNFLPQMPKLQQLTMMNSPGLGKAFVKMVASTPIAPLKRLTEIDLTYNDLNTLDPNIREVFPALNALALDGNSWLCDRRLVWLREWMVTSDVSFSKYEPVICEHPYSLKGREVRDLDEKEFVEEAPPTEPPSAQDYQWMMAGKKGTGSSSDAVAAASQHENSVLAGIEPNPIAATTTATVQSPTTPRLKKLRKQRRGSRRNNQRKGKGKGRKRRGKKGKGRKRRNRKNKKSNKQAAAVKSA